MVLPMFLSDIDASMEFFPCFPIFNVSEMWYPELLCLVMAIGGVSPKHTFHGLYISYYIPVCLHKELPLDSTRKPKRSCQIQKSSNPHDFSRFPRSFSGVFSDSQQPRAPQTIATFHRCLFSSPPDAFATFATSRRRSSLVPPP